MNEIEWVEETNWDNAKKSGTNVRFLSSNGWSQVSGQVDFEGRVWGKAFSEFRTDIFTLYVEKKKVELPTEPGFYLSASKKLATIETDGHWFDDYDILQNIAWAECNAPFTRLEPRHETAKAVLDAVREAGEMSEGYEFNGKPIYEVMEVDLEKVAAEFGVSS